MSVNVALLSPSMTAMFEALQDDLSPYLEAPCMNKQEASIIRQLERCQKKARPTGDGLAVVAIQKFEEVNSLMKDLQPNLDKEIVDNARWFIWTALHRYTKSERPEDIQICFDPLILEDLWRFGPGASNGIRGTHTAEKIDQPMTHTDQARPFVKQLRRLNRYFTTIDSGDSPGLRRVNGSKLATVRKNQETDRTIAIEPSGNMALQLAAGRYLENTLASIGLDIKRQQPLNRKLALLGSIDNSFATIDLRMASDMISDSIVRQLFPLEWYNYLRAIRSPETVLPDGRVLELNMFSTMGNGFTFPLMTFIFVALLYAFRVIRNGPSLWVDWSTAAVFGDDIIVKADEYTDFCELLESAGFIVNHDKSFGSGPFRESCGGDYLSGVDVTPFYVKDLDSRASVYVAINQVLDWSIPRNLYLGKTLHYLVGQLRCKPFLVPEWHNPDEGILSAWSWRRYKYLAVLPETLKYRGNPIYEMMLACGGYTLPCGAHSVYTRRPLKVRRVVRRKRMPQGFLDGWDALKGSHSLAMRRAETVEFILSVS